jgi:hypothetical protein
VQLVRGMRKVALVNCALALATVLSFMGVVLFLLGIVFSITHVASTVTVPIIILGALLTAAPLSVLIALLPESRWLHFFKVDQLIEMLQTEPNAQESNIRSTSRSSVVRAGATRKTRAKKPVARKSVRHKDPAVPHLH